MIDHLGLSRMAVLLVVALIIFGPEKLPDIAAQIGRTLKMLRGSVDSLGSELRASVGPEFGDLRSLHPRTFMSDLLADDAAPAVVAPSPPEAPVWPVAPTGTDAMTLMNAPLDLSSVEQELAALEVTAPGPVETSPTVSTVEA